MAGGFGRDCVLLRVKKIVFIVLAAVSCREESRPAYLVDDVALVRFLADVYATEAKVTSLVLTRDSAEVLFALAERRLFEKHELSDSLYHLTMEYYLGHPHQLSTLYDGLIDTLNLREQKLLTGPPGR
jgi:hypothetical protein